MKEKPSDVGFYLELFRVPPKPHLGQGLLDS